jgi:hypothetical protein
VELFASGADEGTVVVCTFCEKKLETGGLDGTRPLAVAVGVCVAGIGAEGKENKGTAGAVLASCLSFASLDWTFEGGVGSLNKGDGLEGSVTCEPAFGSGGRENEDVLIGGGTESFSSALASGAGAGKAGTVATLFASSSFAFAIASASASAFAFSFSSALRRRRAIASASISCFSHLE